MMIFAQILAAAIFGACLGIFFSCIVFIWFSREQNGHAYPSCDVIGCDQPPSRLLWDVWDHREMHVCGWCADELAARDDYLEMDR